MLPNLDHLLPLGYRFIVYFDFEAFGKGNILPSSPADAFNKAKSINDVKFQSVSGLSVDIETEQYAEGGENRFKHTLPTKTKYPNLVLKRGLAPSSEITDWIQNAVNNFEFKPINITVILQNELKLPMHVWDINHVIPVKWSVDTFNAEESKIVIETLELKYNYFVAKNPEDLLGSIPGT